MIEELTEREANLILELQRATRDRIFPSLRLISVTIQAKSPIVYFFYDGSISEDDLESLNLIDTYFGVDYCPEGLNEGGWDYIRVDYPEPIPYIPGECFYARKENPPLMQPKRGVLIEPWMNRRTKICIALQRAMINNVFQQVRKISTAYTDSTATIHAIVDGIISSDDQKSLELMKNYFALQFPADEMTHCGLVITQIDSPLEMPVFDVLAYLRKETLNYPNQGDQPSHKG